MNNTKQYLNPEPLVLMASMYREYVYLDINFVQKHQCLFGVKAELYNMVKADLVAYEGAYNMWENAYKKYAYSKQCSYKTRKQMQLLDWGELLYGEVRFCSDKERKQYGIKFYVGKR